MPVLSLLKECHPLQKHYSYRTEQAYIGWIKRYTFFHGVRHPAEIACLSGTHQLMPKLICGSGM